MNPVHQPAIVVAAQANRSAQRAADADRAISTAVLTPRLRRLLAALLTALALVAANSAYLSGVRGLEWLSRLRGAPQSWQNSFYLWMVLAHVGGGLLLIVPFAAFAWRHLRLGRHHPNRRAVRLGYAFVAAGLLVLVSGLLLLRAGIFDLKHPVARDVVFWVHFAAPCGAGLLYALHRLSGPPVRWRSGWGYAGLSAAAVVAMMVAHPQSERARAPVAAADRADFRPSLARISTGAHLPADQLMMDAYCMKCHPDAYDSWAHSAHHLSSFNNPMYLASIRETRAVVQKRDGAVTASRWCAGCHDPVPLLTGAFDDPQFDDVQHPTAHAGITCTTCHMISAVNSPRGNADYTMTPAEHYPFTGSSSSVLRYINEQLIKAKPSFHKRTFLKPLHKSSEFCAACHKVHLPRELNQYRDFVRGQNHFDSFHLSGVSGHGARSSYFPMRAAENCGKCHMPPVASDDFGARPDPKSGALAIHDHLFPGANTALPHLHGWDDVVQRHQEFLKTAARVDIVALRDNGRLDGAVTAPLRRPILLKDNNRDVHELALSQLQADSDLPALRPGGRYLLDVVIRNLKTGHVLTQGTADSNELWLDVRVTAGDRVIGRSGGMDAQRRVDDWAHFVNAYVLDRHGNRIARRNPQDIYAPLYDNQVNPGSANVVHFDLQVPPDVDDLITVEVKLQYRKFSSAFMDFVTGTAQPGDDPIRDHTRGQPYLNTLPVSTLASDAITFPVAGVERQPPVQEFPIVVDHVYQRWQDYAIALLNEGARLLPSEDAGVELQLAEQILRDAELKFGYVDVRLHLAQLYLLQGRYDEAAVALDRAAEVDKPLFFTEPVYAPWAIAWNRGLLRQQQGDLDAAIDSFREVLAFSNPQIQAHGFDFSQDYVVINQLAHTLQERAKLESGADAESRRRPLYQEAAELFERTLTLDPENIMAHHNLANLYVLLGDESRGAEHRALHARFKPDENARDLAAQAARIRDAAANHAAERVVIYPLQRPGAPELESPTLSASRTGKP